MSLSSLQEEDVLCPPRCGYCCSHLYCHPLLLPPFLQAVGVPGSSILRKFSFNSLTHIQLLRCSIRPDVAELFFSFTCSLIFKWLQTHICFRFFVVVVFKKQNTSNLLSPFFPNKMHLFSWSILLVHVSIIILLYLLCVCKENGETIVCRWSYKNK